MTLKDAEKRIDKLENQLNHITHAMDSLIEATMLLSAELLRMKNDNANNSTELPEAQET